MLIKLLLPQAAVAAARFIGGRAQVVSLSFITAMSRVSEKEAPLVMDTPFGRLSSHHRNSITKPVPELADQCSADI